MSPRKASLRVAHQRTCANATKTSIDSLKSCTCSPSLYIFSRDRDGKPKKSARVKDRQTANRALAAAQREIDEGRVGIAREKNISFDDWATEYEKILDTRIRDSEFHPRTKGSCASTLQRGREAFGGLHLREIGNPELRRFIEPLGSLRPASKLRYLRELSACLKAAIGDRYLEVNLVPSFTKERKLKAPKRGKAPFEDADSSAFGLSWRGSSPSTSSPLASRRRRAQGSAS